MLTDGEPTDCTFAELGELIMTKQKNTYLSVVMCTDEVFIILGEAAEQALSSSSSFFTPVRRRRCRRDTPPVSDSE